MLYDVYYMFSIWLLVILVDETTKNFSLMKRLHSIYVLSMLILILEYSIYFS